VSRTERTSKTHLEYRGPVFVQDGPPSTSLGRDYHASVEHLVERCILRGRPLPADEDVHQCDVLGAPSPEARDVLATSLRDNEAPEELADNADGRRMAALQGFLDDWFESTTALYEADGDLAGGLAGFFLDEGDTMAPLEALASRVNLVKAGQSRPTEVLAEVDWAQLAGLFGCHAPLACRSACRGGCRRRLLLLQLLLQLRHPVAQGAQFLQQFIVALRQGREGRGQGQHECGGGVQLHRGAPCDCSVCGVGVFSDAQWRFAAAMSRWRWRSARAIQ